MMKTEGGKFQHHYCVLARVGYILGGKGEYK